MSFSEVIWCTLQRIRCSTWIFRLFLWDVLRASLNKPFIYKSLLLERKLGHSWYLFCHYWCNLKRNSWEGACKKSIFIVVGGNRKLGVPWGQEQAQALGPACVQWTLANVPGEISQTRFVLLLGNHSFTSTPEFLEIKPWLGCWNITGFLMPTSSSQFREEWQPGRHMLVVHRCVLLGCQH